LATGVWDYGVAVGTIVALFGLFTWIVKFFMNSSSEREKRAEEREKALLDALNDTIEKNSVALSKHSDILDKQYTLLNQLSTQVGEIAKFITCLKQEFSSLKDDLKEDFGRARYYALGREEERRKIDGLG
jgi:hypothetical protein